MDPELDSILTDIFHMLDMMPRELQKVELSLRVVGQRLKEFTELCVERLDKLDAPMKVKKTKPNPKAIKRKSLKPRKRRS